MHDMLVDHIGNTPLIKLRRASEETGCEIYGKAEFLNPGGSIKDRAALSIIRDAEKQETLRPGGLIVESTAGNTGIGIALCANALGYRTLIIMPDNQSKEKKDALRLFGVDLHEVPPVPFSDPNQFQHVGRRMAKELLKTEPNGVIFADQWNNLANKNAHYQMTGPEIWQQTEGTVDGFICSMGTGGTLSGTSKFLKEQNSNIVIGLADPMGAAMFSHFTTGEIKSNGSSISEGIGLGRVTPIVEGMEVDYAWQVPDEEMIIIIFNLLREEGLCVGGSTGINIAGAKRLANELGPGHTIVTMLCDHGTRYQSKLYNSEFLRTKGLPIPDWL